MSVVASAAAAASFAADVLERACRDAIASRGRALVAVSGGTTPVAMLQAFARRDLPWQSVFMAQVDERCVPRDDPRRNLAALEQALVTDGPLARTNLLAVPVSPDESAAEIARRYGRELRDLANGPLTFDIVQLGLGDDGHTASLVPGDPVLAVLDADVASTQAYRGTERVTLTRPAIDRARERLWLVTGSSKAAALAALVAGAGDSPAVSIRRDTTSVVADLDAAISLPASPA